MPELIHKVPREEWYTAERKWIELFNKDKWWGHNNFMTFIGIRDFWYDATTHHINCSELALRKIEMLNSPHAYALMKAFIARTGYHKKLPEK